MFKDVMTNERRPPVPGSAFAGPCRACRGDFVYTPLIKGGAPFDWHVDVCDRNGLALHRAGFTSSTDGTFLGSSLFSVALHGGPSRLACKSAFRGDKRAVQSAE
jgi:hypothetical protein